MVKRRFCPSLLLFFTFALLTGITCWAASPPGEKPECAAHDQQEELQRAQTSLGKLDPAPYFLSYAVYDQSMAVAVGAREAW